MMPAHALRVHPRPGGGYQLGLLLAAALNPLTRRIVSVFRVLGEVLKQLAGEVRAFPAKASFFANGALGQRTFPVKGMAFCGNASAAACGLPERAFPAGKPAIAVNGASDSFKISHIHFTPFHFFLSLPQFKRGDTSFKPGAMGPPASPGASVSKSFSCFPARRAGKHR
jgi:hypothetical protein